MAIALVKWNLIVAHEANNSFRGYPIPGLKRLMRAATYVLLQLINLFKSLFAPS